MTSQYKIVLNSSHLDIAGVGLAHYVENIVNKLGFKQPVLTAQQLESRKARVTVNSARAFGLTIGCLLGMFVPKIIYLHISPS
jgi:hypothetical protein